MDLASVLLACSLHQDDSLLLAVAYAHSQGNPYAVTNVNLSVLDSQDEPQSLLNPPLSLEAARVETGRIIVAGGDPIVGLLPARLAWAHELGKQSDDLFEPCANVAVVSAKISEFDYQCRHRHRSANARPRRTCTLQRYADSLGLGGLDEVVLALLVPVKAPESISRALASTKFPEPLTVIFDLFFGQSKREPTRTPEARYAPAAGRRGDRE
jgi:hypothetical protein